MKCFSMRFRCVLFLPLVLVTCVFAHADTHYVSTTGSDTPPYTSWETAATSIQAAIDAASEGDTVLIGQGTFRESIVMKSGLKLTGSGAGLTTMRALGASVVTCLNVNDVSIESLSITRGHPLWHGGGVHIEDSDQVVVRGCTIVDNRSEYGSGAGICALRSQVTIERCVIQNNRAEAGGGGIFFACAGRPCNISGCVITGNWGSCGGGIQCYCLGEITDCIVANNSASPDEGGGIWCGEAISITRCLIWNNAALASSPRGKGGGVYYRGDQHGRIANCVIAGNLANGTRGHGIFWEANVIIVNCTVLYNRCQRKGWGGIEVAYPAETYGTYENITNCIFSGNVYDLRGCRATYSAMTYADEGEGNIAKDPQFHVYATCEVEAVDHLNDTSTIACKEHMGEQNQYEHMFARVQSDAPVALVAANVGNELLCYGYVSEEFVGHTLEITDFSLSEESPCIDAGNNEAEYLPEQDKAGAFRVYRGRDEWRVDMGAYEYGSRRFAMSAVEPTAEPGHLKLTWNSQDLPGKTYSIHFSPEMLTWILGASNIPSRGDSTSWVDPDASAFRRRFYMISSP